ncbi:MAG: hypothetical protein WA763_00030 [Pseudolabrys sp.]
MKPRVAPNAKIKLCRVAVSLLLVLCLQPVTRAHTDQANSIWVETKWPFLMDQWGEGSSFQCKAADCGAELNLYIRAKIGFCSSTTGVADDNELERLSDFDFMKGQATGLGSGHEVDIAGMKGRIRAYTIGGTILSQTYAFSVEFNNNSDALVATITLSGGPPAAMEPVIIQFLNGKTIQRWVTRTLGL